MLFRDGAKHSLRFVDLNYVDTNFLPSVGLRVERAIGNLRPGKLVVDKALDDIFGTALDVCHYRKMWPKTDAGSILARSLPACIARESHAKKPLV